MAIDLTREQAIPLAQVPKLPWLPRRRGGRRLHVATIHRWCNRGLRGHRLEFVQLGGTRVTTEAALSRFFEALTGDDPQVFIQRGTAARREPGRVCRELDEAGI